MLTWDEATAPIAPREFGALLSYFYYEKRSASFIRDASAEAHMFLDCGAFSAATHGQVIDPDRYARWLQPRLPYVDVAASLDVIHDPVATRRNWLRMRVAGVPAIPVVHLGSDPDWIQRYADAGCDYVALGGLVRASGTVNGVDRDQWITDCHDVARRRGVGLHGFGMTVFGDMRRWPWRSVDSTTWMAGRRWGALYYFDADTSSVVQVFRREMSSRDLAVVSRYGVDATLVKNGSGRFLDLDVVCVQSFAAAARLIRRDNPGFMFYFACDSQDTRALFEVFRHTRSRSP